MKKENQYILGIDYGLAKVGLAKADEETRIAFPWQVIKNDQNFINNILKIIIEESVNQIVIGQSKQNQQKFKAQEVQKIGQEISEKSGKPVFFEEEMFTTRMAIKNIQERPDYSRQSQDDAESARLILESWLNKA
jgi:putative transcription antitermination factor YqgF